MPLIFFCLTLVFICFSPAQAHFLEIIPEKQIISIPKNNKVDLKIAFTHPMEGGPKMEMARPASFGVQTSKGTINLLETLERDGPGFKTTYALSTPDSYVFFMTPKPYWEEGEGKYIRHHTKVVVDYLSANDWERRLDLPVEIIPVSRPYALWTGNVFQGQVLHNGKPVPHSVVEVEWRNDGSLKAPGDLYVTQEIKTDANGVFTYGLAKAGWWGFAALIETHPEDLKNPQGQNAPMEEGGLIWVHVRDMK